MIPESELMYVHDKRNRDISPAQLLLEVHHVLVTLCVVGSLSLHKVIQTA